MFWQVYRRFFQKILRKNTTQQTKKKLYLFAKQNLKKYEKIIKNKKIRRKKYINFRFSLDIGIGWRIFFACVRCSFTNLNKRIDKIAR